MKRVLGREPGVISFELFPLDDVVRVRYDPTQVTTRQIVADLTTAGYAPGSVVEK